MESIFLVHYLRLAWVTVDCFKKTNGPALYEFLFNVSCSDHFQFLQWGFHLQLPDPHKNTTPSIKKGIYGNCSHLASPPPPIRKNVTSPLWKNMFSHLRLILACQKLILILKTLATLSLQVVLQHRIGRGSSTWLCCRIKWHKLGPEN